MEASSLKDAKILKTKHIWLFHSQKVAIQAQKLPQFILFIQPHRQFGRSQKQHDHSRQLHVRMSMSTSSTAAFPHLPEDRPGEGQVEYLDAPNNMENEALGTRKVPFG